MRIVIKIGTAILYQNEELSSRIDNIVEFLSNLNQIHEVMLVSSGAVGAGYTKCKLDKLILQNKQALAAIGQPLLMKEYKDRFSKQNQTVAQVLVTAQDFDSRKRTEHANNMINVLLENKIIPIVNENDTISIDEIVFGDNDQLSAYCAYYFNADLLIILSDIKGLYDKNPKEFNDAKFIKVISEIDEKMLKSKVTPNDKFATGGIVTKLKAGDFVMKKGIDMFLTSGFDLEDVKNFIGNRERKAGTLFKAKK